jgi:hypothetical protein
VVKVPTDEQWSKVLFLLADTILASQPHTGGLPQPILQAFVEGTAVGTADMVKGKKKGKRAVSAYNKAFGKAFKRQKAKMIKKNGEWKKGCSHGKCMKLAHKETKRLLK